jgi:hypothetical protein
MVQTRERCETDSGIEIKPSTSNVDGCLPAAAVTRFAANPHHAELPLVASYDKAPSRIHPAGGRRKLPPAPANPRNARVGKSRSRRESPPIPAQPGSAKTGLSRRRSRVRVPSLPSRFSRDFASPAVELERRRPRNVSAVSANLGLDGLVDVVVDRAETVLEQPGPRLVALRLAERARVVARPHGERVPG